jgi:hypothetical protein
MSLIFADTQPLASGKMRLVFRHPWEPGMLVKVIRPEVIDERWGSGLPWYKSNRRFRQYVSFIREIQEYVAAYAKYGRSLPFLQKVIGLEDTDYGLGLVLEAALDPAGNLAPTLWRMVLDHDFHPDARDALENFFQQILASDVVVADLHPGNLVYAHNQSGGHQFIMIDGLGVSTLIPFKSLSRRLNRRSKVKRIKNLRARITSKLAEIESRTKII